MPLLQDTQLQFVGENPRKPAPAKKCGRAKAEERAGRIREYKRQHPHASIKDVAEALGVSK
jgi:hypothetical protein